MTKLLWNFKQNSWLATKKLFKEGYFYKASALAYTTLLSFVPLISVIVTIVSPFPLMTKWIELTQNFILQNFIPISSSLIEIYLINFIKHASHLSTISFIFLLIISLLLMETIHSAFRDIWRSSINKKKITYLILHWCVLMMTPFFIGIGIFLSSYFGIFLGANNALGMNRYLDTTLLISLSILFNTVIFSMLYIFAPIFKVKLADGFAGGLVAACLFEIAKSGFGFYIVHFSSYQLIYGSLAIIPIFLIWIYLSWLIILFGAIFVQLRSQSRLS